VTTIIRLRVHFWTIAILLLVGFCGALLFHAPLAEAQSTNASVTGYITDPTKAVIVGAKIIVINVDTNVRYEGTTNNSGSYDVPALPPGRYRIEVEKPGFKTVVKSDLILHVQDTAAINFEMALGSQSEIVTVKEGGLVINTTDATVATTIDRNFAENLPLNGRSFQTLIILTPGTVLTPASTSGNGGTFSVNGQRANANAFTLDGVSANLGNNTSYDFNHLNGANPSLTIAGTTQGMVAVDALQEFKIQTSSCAPEFGRQPGGQVSLLTRSGTNAFHGTAFDYLRNDALDANDWFRDRKGLPKGKERQNDFGGTLGGPIFKDKTFFFFSYEGLRLLLPTTSIVQVPSMRLRQEAAPAFQAILNSWPIPDGPESTRPCAPPGSNGCPASGQLPTGAAPYTLSQSFPTNLDSYSIKLDHTLGKNIHFFGRYNHTVSDATFLNGSANQTQTNKLTMRGLTLGIDTSIRLHLENEVRANYSVSLNAGSLNPNLVGGATAFDPSPLYTPELQRGVDRAVWNLELPGIFAGVSPAPLSNFSQRQVNLIDNLSYSIGAHQLKWGVDYRRLFPITGQPPVTVFYGISSEQDLINGIASTIDVSAQVTAHPIFVNFSAYAQDTWRLSRRATLTYGLRWELNPPPGERDGIQPLQIVGLGNPATASLAPFGSSLYQTTYNNFAPRIGLAYQIRQTPGRETVVRGGFGVFYDLASENTTDAFNNPPFQNFAPTMTSVPFPVPRSVHLQIPNPLAPLTPPYSGGGNGLIAVDPNLQLPYTLQWNVAIEQGLGQNQSLTASYVASAGRDLLRSDNLFDFNPNFPLITEVRNASSSNYQALQLQFNRRLSQRLQGLASYTYSHSIDNASDAENVLSTSQTGSSFLNPNIDRGNSDFDLRHAFRGAITYSIPTWNANLLSKAALGGWSVDTIAFTQTGVPVNLVGGNYSSSTLPDAFFQLRPDIVPGQPFYLFGAQCAAVNLVKQHPTPCPGGMGLNPAAFTPVPTDANGNPTRLQGTLGRNALHGFGAWQADFSLHRQFNLNERVNLQFRGEFFNLFNHPNFGTINPNVFQGAGRFGLAIALLNQSMGNAGMNRLYQIGGPRSIQLALKLVF